MIEYIPLAISSLTAAKNIASTLLELRDFDKIASATMDLKSHLIQTYDHIISEKERVLSLQARISELEKECIRLKDWSAEKDNYNREQIAHGISAYLEKNYMGSFETAHKLCCNCFDKSIKSTLQQSIAPGRTRILNCPNGCPNIVFHHYIERHTETS